MKAQRNPIFIPVILVMGGIWILLSNYLPGDYLPVEVDILEYWPLLLVVLGILILLRGDIAPSWQAHTFGITRGSVESADLEISSAEIDVRLSALQRTGRLIAGQYTARSRPRLAVRNNHARLTMRRGDTWLFSWADWGIEIAQDLPWSLLMSAHLGAIQADLRGLQLKQVHIATGIGDIKVICPTDEVGPIYVRSTFGDIQLLIPKDVPAIIQVKASPLSRVITRGGNFEKDESGQYHLTPAYNPDYPALEIVVAAMFGNIQMAIGK